MIQKPCTKNYLAKNHLKLPHMEICLIKLLAKSGIKINRFAKKAFVPKGSQRESGTTEKIKQHTFDALNSLRLKLN